MAKIVVVTSGKGGVGKTTTSAAFASGLALAGHKTAVIDFDVGLRNLDLIMGCERRVVYDLINVIQGEANLSQALIKDKQCDNLFVLAASQTRDKEALTQEGVKKVLDDLAALAEIDLGEAALAAVPDLVMRSFVGLKVAPRGHRGGDTAADYLAGHLGLPDAGRGYFQAGLLVMDLDRLREADLAGRMIRDLETQEFWFLDQDVLNKHLAGRTLPLRRGGDTLRNRRGWGGGGGGIRRFGKPRHLRGGRRFLPVHHRRAVHGDSAAEQAPADGRQQPHHRAHRRGLAHAVAAEQRHHLPGRDAEAEAEHRLRAAVAGGEPLHLQHQASSSPR